MLNNLSTINYFIIGHCKISQNYKFDYTKILVGNSPDPTLADHIICKNLDDNIEHYPYLCSYTGWYATAKNNLINTDIVGLLEYDITIHDLFNTYNKNICNKQLNNNYIIAYNNTLTNHYVFYKSTPWLEISLQRVYGINLMDFVKFYSKHYPVWPTTTNIIMPSEVLKGFIKWFQPMTELFNRHRLGAYVHERAFFVYCILNNIKIIYAPTNLLQHKQAQSHKINDIYGNFLARKNTDILCSSMKGEYDAIYEQSLQECLGSLSTD